MTLVPFVIEQTHQGERSYDIYSRLLKDRIVFISGTIDDALANSVIAQLLFLQSQDAEKDVHIYVNSPGGSISSGLAIYDTMNFIRSDVSTYCIGQASSMGAVLLAAGSAGKRYTLPHSRVMIHQPLSGFTGQASDIEIHANEVITLKKLMNSILAKHTGQPQEKIAKDTDRDYFMNAEQARAYGIVDHIIQHSPALPIGKKA